MSPRKPLSLSDEELMRAAISLARKGAGRTSPNPAVGALVVKAGRIMAKGWHRKAGLAHAEIDALGKLGFNARGATLYVTLEPCCHYGRTPPCTEAIIKSGIKKVVIGSPDPNPLVSGKGVAALRVAGIEVVEGVLSEECASLNEAYAKYITTGMPFVTLKLASTLDGRIATSTGESRWITGTEARRFVHRLRSVNDAVMVGSNTVVKDDPELTVRLASGKDPVRVVLDSTLKTPPTAKVYSGVKGGRARLIIFTTGRASAKKAGKARSLGAEVIEVRGGKNGVDVKRALEELGKKGITSVLAEGGGRLAATLLRSGLADKIDYFIAPALIGSDGVASIAPLGLKRLKAAPRLKRVNFRRLGADLLVEGYLR